MHYLAVQPVPQLQAVGAVVAVCCRSPFLHTYCLHSTSALDICSSTPHLSVEHATSSHSPVVPMDTQSCSELPPPLLGALFFHLVKLQAVPSLK